jgi:hypothetical protein
MAVRAAAVVVAVGVLALAGCGPAGSPAGSGQLSLPVGKSAKPLPDLSYVTGKEKKANAAFYAYTGAMGDAEYDRQVSLEFGGDPNDPKERALPQALAAQGLRSAIHHAGLEGGGAGRSSVAASTFWSAQAVPSL